MIRSLLANINWGILLPVVFLVLLGLVTLFSIQGDYFKAQLVYAIFSLIVFVGISQIDIRLLQIYEKPIYIVSFILLVLVLLLGISSRGAVRWVEIIGFRIQFSEILKPFLLIAFATFLSQRTPTVRNFFLVLLFLSPIVLLIDKQPDLGNAILYCLVVFSTLLVVGYPLWVFLGGIVLVGISFPFLLTFLHGYQRQRLLTFINPASDPLGISYNAIQSLIAVGSGGFFGKGLSLGTQSGLQFLPEHHTDFIFATLSEDLGFVGSVLVIVLFALLLYHMFRVFLDSSDMFCKIFTISAFFLLLIQFFINIGMNIGLVPIVGITLPFVSYGGSSILSSFIIVGIVSSFSRYSKKKEILEIR